MAACPAGVAEDVWAALPEDVRRELVLERGENVVAVVDRPPPHTRKRKHHDEEARGGVVVIVEDEEDHSNDDDDDDDDDDDNDQSAGCGVVGEREPARALAMEVGWKHSVPAWQEVDEVHRAAKREFDIIVAECRKHNRPFTDPAFPPTVESIDGRRSAHAAQRKGKKAHPKCNCGLPARVCTVNKEGINEGRVFWGCAHTKATEWCGFFEWADDTAPHSRGDLSMKWERCGMFSRSVARHDRQGRAVFGASDIKQGRVGDCWLLAALGVVCERPELLARNVITRRRNELGVYQMCLFVDGRWHALVVDDFLPGRVSANKGTFELAFAKADEQQMWVSLVEKAYAKAHGSYRATSGGWIAEALFDVTGFPTETLCLRDRGFDPELVWSRLVSFHQSGCLMGAACQLSDEHRGNGLVGFHAYSVLDVREVHDAVVGRQTKLTDFFGNEGALQGQRADEEPTTTLRLLRLRNPWGRQEWKGAFGKHSQEWTSRLRKQLPHTNARDGTFWIAWEDFVKHFPQVDVCKAHQDWNILSFPGAVMQQAWIAAEAVQVKAAEDSWVVVTVAQPNKRGKASQRFYYTDVALLVLRQDGKGVASVVSLMLSGPCKALHRELVLHATPGPSACYWVVPVSLSRSVYLHARGGEGSTWSRANQWRESAVPFVLRLFSAKPLRARVVPAPAEEEVVGHIHQACAVWSSPKGALTRLHMAHALQRWLSSRAVLVVVQSSGSAVALVRNTSSHAIRVRFLLHGAGEGSSNANPLGPLPWYHVGPETQRIVAVVADVPDQDYEGRGKGGQGQEYFALERLEFEVAVGGPESAGPSAEAGVFRAVKFPGVAVVPPRAPKAIHVVELE